MSRLVATKNSRGTDLRRHRPSVQTHYLNRARIAAERSTCLRRFVGAIIIKDGVEVSSGYVGAPRSAVNCIDVGRCLRTELRIPSGQNYELCRSVHAEQNALINAARSGASVLGGEMYISSRKVPSAYPSRQRGIEKVYGPCLMCIKEIINAGIKAVHMREEGVGTKSYIDEELPSLLTEAEEKQRRHALQRKGRRRRVTRRAVDRR